MNNIENGIKDVDDTIGELNEDITNIQTATASDVGKALKAKTVTNGKVTEWEFGVAGGADPAEIEQAVEDYLDEHPVVVSAAGVVSVADYGAVGDGTTDDSAAIQRAVNDNYDVYFESDKTYYLASSVVIDHDIKLHGGKNTVIKTKTPNGSSMYNGIVVRGTLKKTTTMTTDYVNVGTTDNACNQFTLSDMDGINIGDIMIITATDQYYSYARQMYYLGATLLIGDIYNGHLYTTISMPWDIANTSAVTVKIYDAPEVAIENLNFVSDAINYSTWNYTYCVTLQYCRNAVVRNCNLTNFYNGIQIFHCVNAKIDGVSLSKSKYVNSISADGYGIKIDSSSNTEVRRVLSICAQGCLDLGGTIPCIDTFVKECNLTSECRAIGIDMHENSYNIVVEDCTLGGASIFGTAIITRCRFIRSLRTGGGDRNGINFRGSHDPRWARLRVTDCVFDGSGIASGVSLDRPSVQSPIQSFDCVFGNIEIENCKGGSVIISPTTTADITANIVKRLSIKNWQDCFEIKHKGSSIINYMEVINSTFTNVYWLNSQTQSIVTDNINVLRVISNNPQKNILIGDVQSHGASFVMPEGVSINCVSSDSNAHYVTCGRNLASNNLTDYLIGDVSGNVGAEMTRTVNNAFANALSVNQNGNLVFTQPASTTASATYLKCLYYTREPSAVRVSCKFKNIGETEGQGNRIYITVINCATGLILYKAYTTMATADAEGVTVSKDLIGVPADCLVLAYIYASVPVRNSITEFADFVFNVLPIEQDTGSAIIEPYNGSSRTGDGAITSVEGINNIMVDSSASFDLKFKADVNSTSPNARGVSF